MSTFHEINTRRRAANGTPLATLLRLNLSKKIKQRREMADILAVKNAVNICVSILLFTGYVYLFGIKSVRKYLDKEIIITEQEDPNTNGFHNKPPPGIV